MASEQEVKDILEKAKSELKGYRKLDYGGCECALRNQDGKGPCNFHKKMSYMERAISEGEKMLTINLEEFHAAAQFYISEYSHILKQ